MVIVKSTVWVVTRDDDHDHDYDTFIGVAADRATAQELAEDHAEVDSAQWFSRQGDDLVKHQHIEATLNVDRSTRYYVREQRVEMRES